MTPAGNPPPTLLHRIERLVVGSLMLAAIAVMLAGVFLRYVMVPITDALDMDAVSFFWVEETGEMLLCWLTLIGAAVGVGTRIHFTIAILVHTLPQQTQRTIHVFNAGVTAAFGGILSWQGWNLVQLNATLPSPSLGISLGWSYSAAVVGGLLIVAYALKSINEPLAFDHLGMKVE